MRDQDPTNATQGQKMQPDWIDNKIDVAPLLTVDTRTAKN